MAATLDPELLQAFLPEFEAAAAALGAATDAAAARRAEGALRQMAAAMELGSLAALAGEAEAALDPFDPPALARLAAALAAQAGRIAAAGADLPLPAAEPSPPPVSAPRRRCLVVDDSALMRRLVRDAIAEDPRLDVVGEAADGRRAMAAMAALAPDLTLLDIEMPVMDGLAVLRAWALEGQGEVVVVSSSARPGSAVALEARRLGARGVVGKPSGAFSPDLAVARGAAIRRAACRALGLEPAA